VRTTPTVNPQLSTLNTYDTYGRLTAIEQKNSTGTIASSLYEFDNLNRLTSETIDGVNRQIGYDKIDQVKTVTGSNSEAYTYDENGNRKNSGYATGVNNQLLNDGNYSYEYDKEGNRTKRTNTATGAVDNYTWDYRNRLTGVISQDGSGAGAVTTQTVSYEYDVDNQRVSKTVNGIVEKYVIDRDQIAYVTDGSGTQTFHYLYGTNVDAVMAQDSPTGMVWSLSDRLGSVNLLTDAGGVVVDKRTFDSFGRVLSESNPGVKFRYGYTGREQDVETGLDYYRARYYDAANGRFISVDPIGFGAGDTNLYRYVGNSSTMYTDPSGEWALPSWNDIQQGTTNLYNGVSNAVQNSDIYKGLTNNAQDSLEYYANLAVQGEKEGGIFGGIKQVWGWEGGLLSSLATKENIGRTATALTAVWGISKIATTKLGGAILGNPLVRTWLGAQGVQQGSQEAGQAWYGVGEDGRQLSTPERWLTGFNGALTVGTSAFDLGGVFKTALTARPLYGNTLGIVSHNPDSAGNLGNIDAHSTLALPEGSGLTRTLSQVRNLRGQDRWQAGETFVQELYNSPGQRHFNVPIQGEITGSGGRFVDAPVNMPNGKVVANEVKTYQKWRTVNGSAQQFDVPLSRKIKQQVLKDVWLRDNLPGYEPKWIFVDAPPSPELQKLLNQHKITHITHN
jgi:RHS repeat-associated protein